MMRLRDVKLTPTTERGPFCGPYALATVTGRPIDEFLPRDLRGRVHRRGLFIGEVREHLLRLGFSVQSRSVPKRTSLWRALRPGEFGIAMVTRHYVAVSGFMVRDKGSGRAVWVHDHRSARSRCLVVLVVTKRADGGVFYDEPPVAVDFDAAVSRMRRRAAARREVAR